MNIEKNSPRFANFRAKLKKHAEANGGRIEFETQQGTVFYSTLAEFEEFFDCNVRDRSAVITKILRKAVLKYPDQYPGDNPDAQHRKKYNFTWIIISTADGAVYEKFMVPKRLKIPGISLASRNGRTHIPSNPDGRPISRIMNFPESKGIMSPTRMLRLQNTTILQRLKEHWINTETHPLNEKLFGIELEFCTEQRIVEETIMYREGGCEHLCCLGDGPEIKKIIKRRMPIPSFREIEFLIPGVKFKTDGSVRPCVADAAEATILAGPNGYSRLEKVCKEIRDRGGFVNNTCGLHIHLDARNNEKRVVGIRASKLYDAIEILKDLVPDSRIKECFCHDRALHPGVNHYCKIVKPEFNGDRYTAINLDAYRTHRTIEIRMAAGSLNPKKIWHWANFLLALSNAKNRYTTWYELLKSEFPLYLRIWAVNRAHELRPNEKLRLERMNIISPNLDKILSTPYESSTEIE